MDENRKIVGEYYVGAYGPTIILILNSIESAKWLHDAFLAQIDCVEERKITGSYLELKNVESLSLLSHSSGREIEIMRTTDSHPNSFTIFGTVGGWRDMAGMMEPFMEGQVGHQYFGDELGDDALLEVSFGEGHSRSH